MIDVADKTFVYEGKEVKLTGRTARKNVYRNRRNINTPSGVKTIVEIYPNQIGGNSEEFREWVDPRDLYYVTMSEDEIDVEELKDLNLRVSDDDEDNQSNSGS